MKDKRVKPGKTKPSQKKVKRRSPPKPKPAKHPVLEVPHGVQSTDRLMRLATTVSAIAKGSRLGSRTARLLAAGTAKMAQKVIEEAAETGIEAVRGDVPALVLESVDLLYNLVVLWTHLGVSPAEIWAEMDRREAMFGIAEKLPKPGDA